ncbi:MAG: hypothetical protein JEZ05_03515 [Tenericutes bacterium]|nr:hypothetical protein [Mycoplasmatota bacterium]
MSREELKKKVDSIFPFSILLIIYATVALGIGLFLIIAVLGRMSFVAVIVIVFWAAIAAIILRPLFIRTIIFHYYKTNIDNLIGYLRKLNEKTIKGVLSEESKKFKKIKKVEELIADVEEERRLRSERVVFK